MLVYLDGSIKLGENTVLTVCDEPYPSFNVRLYVNRTVRINRHYRTALEAGTCMHTLFTYRPGIDCLDDFIERLPRSSDTRWYSDDTRI